VGSGEGVKGRPMARCGAMNSSRGRTKGGYGAVTDAGVILSGNILTNKSSRGIYNS
jgi:hypothetical protein